MDRHVRLDPLFANRMRAQKEQKKREELEARVAAETAARKAEADGYAAGMADAQKVLTFEDLKAMAERYENYLDLDFQPHDRERLRREWFNFKDHLIAPAPHSESWRLGYSRGVVDVFRAVDRP